jgi:MscS family membrane protein
MKELSFDGIVKWIEPYTGEQTAWALQIFIVILTVLLFNFIVRRILNRLQRKSQTTHNQWDDAVIYALRLPVPVLIWVLGIAFAADIIHAEKKAAIFKIFDPLRDIGIIASLAWFAIRFIHQAQENLIEKYRDTEGGLDRTTITALGKLVRLAVIITAVLITLQTLGVSVTGVMAFGGIGGIAIGFAAKDLLANFFGGMMIYLDRPFTEGDWIRSPDKDIEGTVENIGWRLTCIRRFNKRPLYVPNSIFASIAVENPSRMLNRQINETIGIRYDDIGKMADIVSDVKSMLCNHEEIDQDQTMIVNFNAFNASSVDFFIYTFTKTTQWIRFHEIKQEILLKVAEIIDQHGAEIAFPTQTLHMHQASPEPEPLNPTLNEGKA